MGYITCLFSFIWHLNLGRETIIENVLVSQTIWFLSDAKNDTIKCNTKA